MGTDSHHAADRSLKAGPVRKLAKPVVSSQSGRSPQPPRKPSRVVGGVAIAIILLSIAGIGVSGWLALQLIVNPQTLIWINRYLPNWIPLPVTGLKPPQTLNKIQQEIRQAGRIPGAAINLGQNQSFLDEKSVASDLLLPVFEQPPHCQQACERIVELRIYQSAPNKHQRETYYHLVNQLSIVGPEESFAIAPLINAEAANQGSTRPLPLVSLQQYQNVKLPGGTWLNLSGQWTRGEGTVTYGQLIHYNPSYFHLSVMLPWSSPAAQEPVWQEVIGGGTPELIVNQTVGMEPAFQIYQIKPLNFLPNPLQLEPIALLEPAIRNQKYENALMLARSGLWSSSLQWLRSFKQKQSPTWPMTAQAQMELVQWHAKITQMQSEQNWASPAQQVLANLIDGRWARALHTFEASADNSRETAAMLKADPGRLFDRVEAALRVSQAQPEVKAWGALLIAAKTSRAAAIAWLRKQPKTTASEIARIDRLIQRLDNSFSEPEPTLNLPTGQLFGSAQRVSRIVASEWLKPKSVPALKLDEQQQWYRVQVNGFHNGRRWRFSNSGLGLSATASAETLWKQVGLSTDPFLQILFWQVDGQQHSISAEAKAVRMQGSGLEVLVAGESIPQNLEQVAELQPLALTDSALQWLATETLSLAELAQQRSPWAKKAIPSLIKELQRSKALPANLAPDWTDLETGGMGDWLVQQVPFTDSKQSDIIVSIYPDMLANLKQKDEQPQKPQKQKNLRSRTLIFSAAGKLLYSEFSRDADQTFLTIADSGDGIPVLVVNTTRDYRLLRWSAQRQRFE